MNRSEVIGFIIDAGAGVGVMSVFIIWGEVKVGVGIGVDSAPGGLMTIIQ